MVLLPGLLALDNTLVVMGRWLNELGYATQRGGLGRNMRCGEETVGELVRRVEALAVAHEQRVALVGQSRGGHMARVVAVRRPDLVSGVVTLGSPEADLGAVHPVIGLVALGVVCAGSAGVPGLGKISCVRGSCCERYRSDLLGPFPPEVGYTSVWSRRDACVRHVLDRDAEKVEITAGHCGMAFEPEALRVVAEALTRFEPTFAGASASVDRPLAAEA